MTTNETIDLLKRLNVLFPGANYEEPIQIGAWTIALEDYSEDMVYKGVRLLNKTHRFGRPTPADLIRCIEAIRDQMEYEARLAWTEISSKRTIGYSWEEVLGLISGRAREVLAEMIRTGVTELKNPLADGTWQILDNKQGFLNLYYVRFEHGKVDNLIMAESALRLNAPKEVMV